MLLPTPCAPVRAVSSSLISSLAVRLFVLLGCLCLPLGASAAAETSSRQSMELPIGTGTLVRFGESASSIFIANPEIADIQTASDKSVFVIGKKAGRTTLYALGSGDRVLVQRDITVVHNTGQLSDQLRAEFPGYRLTLTSSPGRLVVSGGVSTPQEAEAIMALAKGYVGQGETVINQLKVLAPTQVQLRVRIAEVQRNIDNRFGVNWDAILNPGAFAFRLVTGRDFMVFDKDTGQQALQMAPEGAGSLVSGYSNNRVNLTAVIDALNAEGLVSVLAEPNLTAASGQTASFLAGGEFPIPVSASTDSNKITVAFKQYGVSLNFTPTILSPERISLLVRPEVSELTDAGAVMATGVQIPALTVRRVETTVDLGSGESFAIAGLLQNSSRDTLDKFPMLGDLPVLGPLFSSSRFRKNESELVVIVTPYLVTPAAPGTLQTPLDGLRPAGHLERLFAGRMAKQGTATGATAPIGPDGVRLNGSAGFIY